MTTRLQFLTAVRTELQDPGPGFLWADALLQQFLLDGLNQLALDIPVIKELTIAAVLNQRDYVIAVGTLLITPGGVKEVQFPAGVVIPPGRTSEQYDGLWPSGTPSGLTSYPQVWELLEQAGDSQTLRFRYNLAQTGSIIIRAMTAYTAPSVDASVLDVSTFDEIPLRWLVCRSAMRWLEDTRNKRDGGALSLRRSSVDYSQMYKDALQARRRASGVKSSAVVV